MVQNFNKPAKADLPEDNDALFALYKNRGHSCQKRDRKQIHLSGGDHFEKVPQQGRRV